MVGIKPLYVNVLHRGDEQSVSCMNDICELQTFSNVSLL